MMAVQPDGSQGGGSARCVLQVKTVLLMRAEERKSAIEVTAETVTLQQLLQACERPLFVRSPEWRAVALSVES